VNLVQENGDLALQAHGQKYLYWFKKYRPYAKIALGQDYRMTEKGEISFWYPQNFVRPTRYFLFQI